MVNDGSTDDTEALIRKYPTIRVLSHTPNRGKTYALSRGIAAARCDHLMLLDADLAGIKPADIDALAAPVMRGEADVSISLRSTVSGSTASSASISSPASGSSRNA